MTLEQLRNIQTEYNEKSARFSHRVLICAGGGCVSSACGEVRDACRDKLEELGLTGQVSVEETGCMGLCALGPVMLILPERTFYVELNAQKAAEIMETHVAKGQTAEKYTYFDPLKQRHIPCIDDIDFYKDQVRIALRNCGIMPFGEAESYIARGGYQAIGTALTGKTPQEVIDVIKASGLRGRGGAGFPTGIKWQAGHDAKGDTKYIVCNADEGDPGAFMDRSILEGDPHTVLEGMLLAGYAIGARHGFVYVRAEYPVAIERLTQAIAQARELGLMGSGLFGSAFSFDVDIRIGAGAFVCGEETALMASIESQRGEPRQKPPYPFQEGLYGCPTIINNVETLAMVPDILAKGADWFAQYGTENSKGTKVFALAGDIVNTGLIEVPIGMPIGDIIFKIGGGMRDRKRFKAVQIGGPSGGCLTEDMLNTPTDYEALAARGAIMGSGGIIAMNEDTCMVDTARFFMDFIQDESCGKCVACRIGTKRMLEILTAITTGEGREGDIELLEELGTTIIDTAMCGLGQTAPNPVLSTIRNFRQEYEDHIREGFCRAGVCGELFISPCENTCPANINIPGYLSLISAGRFIDAYDLIRQENPMPAVCGRICTRPCESKCRRATLDEAMSICSLKRFVADYAFRSQTRQTEDIVFPQKNKRVSVIGAGPAGLTCAYYLARLGYEVDVYDSNPLAGGTLAYGIPEYRLPNDVLQHEIDLMRSSGFHIHLNTTVGKNIAFDKLRETSDAVFVATGTQLPQKINIAGEDLDGVLPGIDFLKSVKLYGSMDFTGKRVAVIGGGNTAVDSARTALRLGAADVKILYRRTRDIMPAFDVEIDEALEEGIELIELVSPTRFIAGVDGKLQQVACVHRRISDFDNRGRRNTAHIEGTGFVLDIDYAIVAASQYADLPFIHKSDIGLTPWGTFTVDKKTLMTTMNGVFAGGDVIRGPDDVIRAIADGKQAASSIDRFLGGSGKLNKGREIDIPDTFDADDEVIMHKRFPQEYLPLEQRGHNFDEVNLGYHKLNAIAEAMRCLHCERR